MQLTPRYDGPPVLCLDGPPEAVLTPVVRQRRRLVATLRTLTAEQWAHPSRCAEWAVRDVVAHLVDTDAFWQFSLTCGLAGEPTRFLATFDPVASPIALVAAKDGLAPADLVDALEANGEALVATLSGLDADGWAARAEAPPGHLTIAAVASHALWDSWVHERDIAVPLGLELVVHADEVATCLRYACGLSPAFAAVGGAPLRGTFALQATEPDLTVVVEAGDPVLVRGGPVPEGAPVLRGGATDLLEALSFRRPLPEGTPDRWRPVLDGLARVFDTTVAG